MKNVHKWNITSGKNVYTKMKYATNEIQHKYGMLKHIQTKALIVGCTNHTFFLFNIATLKPLFVFYHIILYCILSYYIKSFLMTFCIKLLNLIHTNKKGP